MTYLSEQIQATLAFQRKIQRPILSVLKPLFDSFSINFFAHERMFSDTSKAFIVSNVEVVEFWLRKQYPLDITLDTGCYLGDKLSDIYPMEIQEALGTHFNIAHPLFIVDKQADFTDAFMIATTVENHYIIHAYLTYMEEIKNFLAYYLNSCRRIIKLAEKNRIKLISLPTPEKITTIIPSNPLSDVFNKRYFINEEIGFVSLTSRELTCLSYLIKGKSASEIGLLLNISKRTVETYIVKLKEKFHCSKITELAYIIGKSKINFELACKQS